MFLFFPIMHFWGHEFLIKKKILHQNIVILFPECFGVPVNFTSVSVLDLFLLPLPCGDQGFPSSPPLSPNCPLAMPPLPGALPQPGSPPGSTIPSGSFQQPSLPSQ